MAAQLKKIRKTINDILEGADLTAVDPKKIRTEVEEKLDLDLEEREKEIEDLIMEIVEEKKGKEEDEDEDEEEKPAKAKKHRSAKKESNDEGSPEKESEDEEKPAKKATKRKAAGMNGANGNAAKAANGAGAAKGGTGLTKTCKLSKELAELMGKPAMSRPEVIKAMWKIIKEENLYDPRNKQFAICTPELQTVIGVKRFKTFGMMKYLKKHFIAE